MKATYPVEFHDATSQTGRLRKIGTARVLFPAYVSKKSALTYGFKHLTDDDSHLEMTIYRRSNTVALATACKQYSFNFLQFNVGWSDKELVEYLNMHEGWKPSVLKGVRNSLSYKHHRRDKAHALYRWEADLPNEWIVFTDAVKIIDREMAEHAIPTNYTVDNTVQVDDPQHRVGWCNIHKRAGLIGKAFRYEIHLMKSSHIHTVLHELAHVLDYHYYRANNHGPSFMLVYANLLNKYYNQDFMPSMIDRGLFQGAL